MGEDLFFNLQLYLHAKKIVSIDWAPYHYRHTENSSCVQRTRRSIDSDIAIAGLIEKLMREELSGMAQHLSRNQQKHMAI